MIQRIHALSTASILLLLACVTVRGADTDLPQTQFATPEEAVKAFEAATKTVDKDSILKIFGPAAKEIANPDAVGAAQDWKDLAKRFTEFSNLVKADDNSSAILYLGAANFSIPLKKKDEKWYFDTIEGKEEILNRRIGENEIDTIAVCREYVDAQREYALTDHNADDVVEYAQKTMSTPGKQDGLYWESKPEEEQSPFGPLAAKAFVVGYPKEGPAPEPFYGYYYRILTKQGEKAPGGKYDYIINGHMVAGFALIAYPAEWGNSGVMTFIVSQRGKVLQKDLGEKTKDLAQAIDSYDPDDSWTPVSDNEVTPDKADKADKADKDKAEKVDK